MPDGPTVLGGRYRLQSLIGHGGMAEVHSALDLRLDRLVAVKLLSTALAADPGAEARFRREAQSAARLNDPAIVSVFDTGEDTDPATGVGVPYLVMELVEGATLRAALNQQSPLDPARALRITAGVLDALAAAHAAGIVHRDIKPANVMLTPTGAVKVMDFGIARTVDETSSLTQTSAVIGTAQYLSPEQARGEKVDARTDLYSAGCLLFELLVGRPPFVGESAISIVYQHVREEPTPPSRLNPALGPAVDAVVLRALAKDRAARYQTAAEMRADLNRLLSDDNLGPPGPGGVAVASGARDAAPSRPAAGTAPTTGSGAPLVAADDVGGTTTGGVGSTAPVVVGSTTGALRPTTAGAVAATTAAGPDPAAAEGRRRSRTVGRLLVAAAVALLVLGLGAYGLDRMLMPSAGSVASVEVPRVVGSSRADADAALRNAGLVPRFTNVRDRADDTIDRVVEQDPAAGGEVASGSVVTVAVNVGPATARIPGDLVGQDVDRVTETLEDAGFRVRTEATDPGSAAVSRGEVVAVEPGEGRTVALGETVLVRHADRDGTRAAPVPDRSSAPAQPSEDDSDRSDDSGTDDGSERNGDDGTEGGEDSDDEPPDTRPTSGATGTAPAPAPSTGSGSAPTQSSAPRATRPPSAPSSSKKPKPSKPDPSRKPTKKPR